MDQALREKMIKKARENGVKHGKTAELDFGAGAEWMYEQLKNTSHNSEYKQCSHNEKYIGIKSDTNELFCIKCNRVVSN